MNEKRKTVETVAFALMLAAAIALTVIDLIFLPDKVIVRLGSLEIERSKYLVSLLAFGASALSAVVTFLTDKKSRGAIFYIIGMAVLVMLALSTIGG